MSSSYSLYLSVLHQARESGANNSQAEMNFDRLLQFKVTLVSSMMLA